MMRSASFLVYGLAILVGVWCLVVNVWFGPEGDWGRAFGVFIGAFDIVWGTYQLTKTLDR